MNILHNLLYRNRSLYIKEDYNSYYVDIGVCKIIKKYSWRDGHFWTAVVYLNENGKVYKYVSESFIYTEHAYIETFESLDDFYNKEGIKTISINEYKRK